MSNYRLIGSLTSPYARKVRIVLHEKNIAYEWILDNVWGAQPYVTQFNPLVQVPCLILPDDMVLTDSRSIIDYLELVAPSALTLTLAQKLQVLKWQAFAEGIIDTLAKCRFEQIRPENLQSADWIARQMNKLTNVFALIDTHLANQQWLANDVYSLADTALQCGLNFADFRLTDWHWRETYPNLARFEARLAQQPLYRDTYPRDA